MCIKMRAYNVVANLRHQRIRSACGLTSQLHEDAAGIVISLAASAEEILSHEQSEG